MLECQKYQLLCVYSWQQRNLGDFLQGVCSEPEKVVTVQDSLNLSYSGVTDSGIVHLSGKQPIGCACARLSSMYLTLDLLISMDGICTSLTMGVRCRQDTVLWSVLLGCLSCSWKEFWFCRRWLQYCAWDGTNFQVWCRFATSTWIRASSPTQEWSGSVNWQVRLNLEWVSFLSSSFSSNVGVWIVPWGTVNKCYRVGCHLLSLWYSYKRARLEDCTLVLHCRSHPTWSLWFQGKRLWSSLSEKLEAVAVAWAVWGRPHRYWSWVSQGLIWCDFASPHYIRTQLCCFYCVLSSLRSNVCAHLVYLF